MMWPECGQMTMRTSRTRNDCRRSCPCTLAIIRDELLLLTLTDSLTDRPHPYQNWACTRRRAVSPPSVAATARRVGLTAGGVAVTSAVTRAGTAGPRPSGDAGTGAEPPSCTPQAAHAEHQRGRHRRSWSCRCWPLRTADPGGTSHQGVWIALFAAAQARLRLRRRAAARAIPSILNVVMPTQVALPLSQPVTAARRGCCHLVSRSCHPRRLPTGTMRTA